MRLNSSCFHPLNGPQSLRLMSFQRIVVVTLCMLWVSRLLSLEGAIWKSNALTISICSIFGNQAMYRSDKSWTFPKTFGQPPTPRSGHSSFINGARIYIFGGTTQKGLMADLHVFDLESVFNTFQNREVGINFFGKALLQAQDQGTRWCLQILDMPSFLVDTL